MNFLEKIRNQPEAVRKVILWTVVIVFSLCLFFVWFRSFQKKLRALQKERVIEKIELPDFGEKLKNKVEIPEISKEDLEKLEEAIKEAGNETE